MSSTSQEARSLIAVGIDIGSSQSRVAVCSSSSENAARVVSNTLGHRSTLSMTTAEEKGQYIHGEAALRLLQKEKKPTPSVRDVLKSDNDENEEAGSCEAFVSHLASLACDATASSPQDIRVVLSVPTDASAEYIDTIKGDTEAGIKKSIADKRQRKHHVVVGVIYDAVAACIAHGLLREDTTSSSNTGCNKNILVIDAGASGLNISHLTTNGTSHMVSLAKHKKLADVSGPALVALMSKHIASQFERKYKIPSGDVWESKRARYKLLAACERALASLKTNSSSSVHITIDGLYEGIDCHLPLSKPRWEMLTAPLLKQAQGFVQEFASVQPDAVLLAGSGTSFVEEIVTKTFPDAYRGMSNIPPDESVAMGCAMYAASCLEHEKVKITSPMHKDIALSPVELCVGDSDENKTTLIGVGTPLPAHVVHSLSPKDQVAIWQTAPTIKRVANLTKLPKNKNVEVVVELSIEGKLSIAIDAGPITTI